MGTISINPIDQGTNIITGTGASAGITFSGTENGLDGQQIGIEIELGYGSIRFAGALETVAGSGPWSATMAAGSATTLPDGIYTATAFDEASQNASNQPSETVIVAEHATPFEVIGEAFNDVTQQLTSEPFILSIHQELVAEEAGLQALLHYDRIAAPQIDALIIGVELEQKFLGFTAQSVGYAGANTIAEIQLVQGLMAEFVHHSPALLAQMPDNIGWTIPVDTDHILVGIVGIGL